MQYQFSGNQSEIEYALDSLTIIRKNDDKYSLKHNKSELIIGDGSQFIKGVMKWNDDYLSEAHGGKVKVPKISQGTLDEINRELKSWGEADDVNWYSWDAIYFDKEDKNILKFYYTFLIVN